MSLSDTSGMKFTPELYVNILQLQVTYIVNYAFYKRTPEMVGVVN